MQFRSRPIQRPWKIEQTRTPVCVYFREFGISAWRFYGVLIVSRIYRTIKSNAQRSDRETRILIRIAIIVVLRLVITHSRFDKGATLGCADSINFIDINRRQSVRKISIRYTFLSDLHMLEKMAVIQM